MKDNLFYIVQSLSKFSAILSNKYQFADRPWVLVSENNDFVKYIFRSNNELVISKQGKISFGSWEFLPSVNSIVFRSEKTDLLLKQAFIDNGLMVLKVDGKSDEIMYFLNEDVVPSLNLKEHLLEIRRKKFKLKSIKLKNGHVLDIERNIDNYHNELGLVDTVNGDQSVDVKFKTYDNQRVYELKEGVIKRILYLNDYTLSHGQLIKISN